MNNSGKIKTLALLLLAAGTVLAPRVLAFDPISSGLIAPVGVKAAEIATPYAIKGFMNGVAGFVDIGKDVVGIIKLPVGLVGCTVGAPFGFFNTGLKWATQGAIAPFQLGWHAATLPVRFAGVNL